MKRRKTTDAERPLIVQCQERTAEIHARTVSVERACKAIGYEPGSSYERVAAMIAKTCGHETLTRCLKDIANDRDIKFSERQTKRAIDDLVDVGLLLSVAPPEPQFKRRGRPRKVFSLRINWPHVREILANESGCSTPPEYSAFDRRETGVKPASDRHLENHTALYSHNPNIPGSPTPSRPSNERDAVENQENHSVGASVSVDGVRRRMTTTDVQATASRIFVGLDYFGGNASTLWLVAAAYDAGLLAEADIADSIRGAYECSQPRYRVAYFRKCLANRLQLDSAGMRSLLAQTVIVGGAPEGPPASALAAKSKQAGRRKLAIGYDASKPSEQEIANASQSLINTLAKEVLAR